MNLISRVTKRSCLHVSLRVFLFVLVPVAAVLLRFSMAYYSGTTERQAAQWVRHQNGHISYDYEQRDSGSHPQDVKPPATQWLRDLLGVEFFSDVRCVTLDNKEISNILPITEFRDLKILAINIFIQPDADLSVIAKLKNLEILWFDFTSISKDQACQIERLEAALPNCKIQFGDNVAL